jgi:hypothetical protein
MLRAHCLHGYHKLVPRWHSFRLLPRASRSTNRSTTHRFCAVSATVRHNADQRQNGGYARAAGRPAATARDSIRRLP